MMESGLADDAARRAELLNRQKMEEQAARDGQLAQNKQKREDRMNMANAMDANNNNTPNVAALAANDWANNSHRSATMQNISGTGFVEPRWQPDEEVSMCNRCRRNFDYFNRKHHCRHCGLVFCDGCTRCRALLPVAFNKKEPERVCGQCNDMLEPHQKDLAEIISNSLRSNEIDLTDSLARYCNMPFSLTMGAEIRKATYSLVNLFTSDWIQDKSVPAQLMENARGIAFLTIGKGGVVLAPKFGTGLVIAKLPDDTWSAPTAIGTFGVTWGLLAGADITDFVVFLNSSEAINAFSGAGNVQLGAELGVAVGPIGREAGGRVNIGENGYAPAIAYAHSKGLYAGLGLDGSLIITRPDVNLNFYGQAHTPEEILNGIVTPPKAAEVLYEAIFKYASDPYGNHEATFHASADGSYDPYAMPEPAAAASAGGGGGGVSGAKEDTVFEFDEAIGSVHV
jgi:lipid-binding SYLF domain-containing protein